jgi:hypothetical protein
VEDSCEHVNNVCALELFNSSLATAQQATSQEVLSSVGLLITNITEEAIPHLVQRRNACLADRLEPFSARNLSSPLRPDDSEAHPASYQTANEQFIAGIKDEIA